MMLPLTSEKTLKQWSRNGNQGLYYNKFFNQWGGGFNQVTKPSGNFVGGKMAWVERFKGQVSGVSAASKRIHDLAEALKGCSASYSTTAPFITGMGLEHPVENGFLWHHTLGVPYLPGSSIKGLMRAWAEHWEGEKAEASRIFGSAAEGEGAGTIIVFDALPIGQLTLMAEVLTPHDGGWRNSTDTENKAPSDWISPVPIPFLAVAPGAVFQFSIAPRPGSKTADKDVSAAMVWLGEALDWLGAGAKTSSGFGRFEKSEMPWSVGDQAIFHIAGGMQVSIHEIAKDYILVKNNKNGRVTKVTKLELLSRS